MDPAPAATKQPRQTPAPTIMARLGLHRLFLGTVQAVISVLVVLVILVMLAGLWRVLLSTVSIFRNEPLGAAMNAVIADILSLLVVIELFRSFIEYQECQRLRLHSLLSAALVFVVRELILAIYGGHEANPLQFLGFAVVILALGVVRTLAIRYTPEQLPGHAGAEHPAGHADPDRPEC
jgi:uncharacterized membrane protein (DUF373 family)